MNDLPNIFGEETRVFIQTAAAKSTHPNTIELRAPLRKSIEDFLDVYQDEKAPLFVYVTVVEGSFIDIFRLLHKDALKGKVSQIFSSFRQTLAERGLDIRNELLTASRMPSDYEAREHLRLFNLRLRQHVEDFPTHYNNPVRQPGQGGKLRERLYIPPIKINWF